MTPLPNCAVANWKVCARLICGLNCQSKFSKGSRSGNCHQLLAPLSPPVAATFWFQSYNRSLPMALHSLDSAFCGLKNDHCRQCGIQEGAVDTANHIHRNRRAEQVGLVLSDNLDSVRSVLPVNLLRI